MVGKFSAVESLRPSSKERKNIVGLHTKTIFKCTRNLLPSKCLPVTFFVVREQTVNIFLVIFT